MAAVSARKIAGPKENVWHRGWLWRTVFSSCENPPSGPTKTLVHAGDKLVLGATVRSKATRIGCNATSRHCMSGMGGYIFGSVKRSLCSTASLQAPSNRSMFMVETCVCWVTIG